MNAETMIRRYGLLALAALLLVAAAITYWQADRTRSTDNVGNHALVDDTATTDVQTEVSQALVRVFSYDYSNPAPTEQAADDLLAGQARREYDTLFAALDKKAAGQQLTMTAQVQVAAVKELDGDHATLLVFLDQASQRKSDKESTVSAAQLSVKAERVDGTWRVTGLTPL